MGCGLQLELVSCLVNSLNAVRIGLGGIQTHLVDLLGLEDVLHYFVVCHELIFVLCVHLHPVHRQIAWRRLSLKQ